MTPVVTWQGPVGAHLLSSSVAQTVGGRGQGRGVAVACGDVLSDCMCYPFVGRERAESRAHANQAGSVGAIVKNLLEAPEAYALGAGARVKVSALSVFPSFSLSSLSHSV